jgi:tol-pal system protein YbgF
MFRQPLLPRACLSVALGLVVLAAPVAGWSQDRSTDERLDRLERDLNMLQRQVYRGAPPPVMAGDGNAAADVEVRMERLEQQMRDLTGRIEEVMNRVEQVRQRVEQVNSDVDMRFSQSGAPPAARVAETAPPHPPHADDLPFPPPPAAPAGDLRPPRQAFGGGPSARPPGRPPPGGLEPIFGTLTPPGARPTALTPPAARPAPAQLASVAPAAAGGGLPKGSPGEQFTYAFGLLRKANYPAAEAALRAFVAEHPKDPLAGNAQYWIGETYYARHQYLQAASAFAEAYKRYPKSAKAPDDLLKLGMSLGRANQKQNACLALTQLDRDFPHPAAAIREHATAERKRLGCS